MTTILRITPDLGTQTGAPRGRTDCPVRIVVTSRIEERRTSRAPRPLCRRALPPVPESSCRLRNDRVDLVAIAHVDRAALRELHLRNRLAVLVDVDQDPYLETSAALRGLTHHPFSVRSLLIREVLIAMISKLSMTVGEEANPAAIRVSLAHPIILP